VTVRSQFVLKSVDCQHSSVKPFVFEQKVKAPNFIFVNLMATLRPYLVTGTPYQRLAVLAIKKYQKLVKLTLTKLKSH
jgi:hypothetical protein